jgi:hypothetical protein
MFTAARTPLRKLPFTPHTFPPMSHTISTPNRPHFPIHASLFHLSNKNSIFILTIPDISTLSPSTQR